MKKAIVFCILGMAAAAPVCGFTISGNYTGTTNYVSKSGNDANNGKSWETAKKTIQAAVDLCADGDTVIVDDGEYSDTTAWTTTNSGTTYNNPVVVKITKRIHLVSRNGKAKTHIVGQLANTASGVANDGTAHRCIYVSNVANVLIEGFTIRNGATAGALAGNNTFDSAGGVCGASSSTGYLVDCDVVNCRAGVGAALSRGIVPIRCTFVGNYSVNAQYVFYRTTGAYNCVIANNGPASRAGACFASVQGVKAVNCTFIDNTCAGFAANDTNSARTHRVWNCAFLGANETGGATANLYFTNCVQTATGGQIGQQADAGCKAGVSEFQHYYAADADAWRFLSGGDLYNAGLDDARAIAATFVPEEYLDTDFFGNPRKVGAHVDIGAIESQSEPVAAPASGYIQLGTNVAVRCGDKLVSFPRGLVAVDADMQQVRLVPTIGDSTPFFGFSVSGSWSSFYRYPDLGADRGAWMTPPAVGEKVSPSAKAATDEMWVDAAYAGSDSDGSESKPYTTITDAAAAISDYGLIHVKAGTYDTGSSLLTDHTVPARVAIDRHVAVRSESGAAQTFIVGDASTRCVAVRSYSYNVHFQGFTITGGTADHESNEFGGRGAGFWVTSTAWANATRLSLPNLRSSQVTDCVFSNNVARQGAAMCAGWAQRCVFTDNRMGATCLDRGAVAYCAVLSGCLVTNNVQTYAHAGKMICGLYHCMPYNTTFAETNKVPGTSETFRPVDMNTPAYNCAFLGGHLDTASTSIIAPSGNIGDLSFANFPWFSRYDSNILFVDAAAGDLHITPESGAAYDGDGTADRAAMFEVGDFEGNAIKYVYGNPVPGAYSDVAILPPRDLYVDAVNGDDAKDGLSAATAKKTLAAILPLAHSRDTVHAARGDYNEGSETYSKPLIVAAQNGAYSPARGVVRSGVTLVADEGPDVTFITGVLGTGNNNNLGSDAIRCLTALPRSVIRGFTLRTGATFHTTGGERDENMGGCVLAPSCSGSLTGTAFIENCILTNGSARTAGCVAGGILSRCMVVYGGSTSGANISMHSRYEHCLILNNRGNNSGIRNCGGMASTTYISLGGSSHTSNGELLATMSGARFENSILITQNRDYQGSHTAFKNVRNCIWAVGGDRLQIDPATSANVITGTLETAMLDAAHGYRPLAGSPAINAGGKTLLANLIGDASTDYAGVQRIYDGEVDIGAYEYDIRPAMAALLYKNATVTAAAPAATLAGETIVLPSGEVAATFASSSTARFLVPVQVTGTGTFAIYVGDAAEPAATATAADGAPELRLAVPAGETARFVYEPGANDTGAAILGSLVNASGMTIIFK